ncbi:uncharacterized protein LY89DRAFT_222434 [Mollisia scopiformis]|uniref:Uncharacterized protein n=1 Tax=Mollisia scopiformis TaxID=149040 RepID=A0A194WWR5_MOLSC|nr:uncharacterized protein LY89DRAFT_222434 [Mollisia scopiformis]KUJ12124.1 hypothetical protein LY89DRAFT_222434 [Mollisia scopiformis]
MSTSKKVLAEGSHKRSSSTAENSQPQPPVKRQAQEAEPKVEPQYVYVVSVDGFDRGGNNIPDIWGIYATVKDANNTVKDIVKDKYGGTSSYDRDIDEDGLESWSSDDTGYGESVWVHTEKKLVEPAGSVPDCEWEDLEDEEDEDEDEEEEEEDEEDAQESE